MRTVNAKCGSVIPLGRLGENEATVVVFDIAEWLTTFGDGGTFSLLNIRNESDTTAYPCFVTRDGNKVNWEIKSADVAIVGYGKCELIYTVNNTIAKSEVFTTVVGKALTGGGEVPEPWEDWVERVLQAGADAQDAKYVWENMMAVGEESEEAFADYSNGMLTIGVPRGRDGADGRDGRDGVDGRNGVDAKINGYNTVNIVAGDNITIDQDGNTLTINGEAGGGGTGDHRQLSNRDAANQHPISAIDGLQTALNGKQPVGDYALRSEIPSVPTALSQLSGDSTHRVVTDAEKSTWNAKQSAISDLATIRSGAALGATAVQPETGKGLFSGNYNDLTNKPTIPSAVTESTVSGWGFTKNTGTYSKPSGGIPKTDLASAVQTSLSKADTALQSVPSTYALKSDLPTKTSDLTNDSGYLTLETLPIYNGGVS